MACVRRASRTRSSGAGPRVRGGAARRRGGALPRVRSLGLQEAILLNGML